MFNLRNDYEDVLSDYTRRIEKEYDTLPTIWLEYFIVKVNNLISYFMRWEHVYNIQYQHNNKCYVITGLPPIEFRKRNQEPIPTQIEYVLGKMHFEQAIITIHRKDIIKITFYREMQDTEKPRVYTEHTKYEVTETTTLEDNVNCNILTPIETPDDEPTDVTSELIGGNDG